MFKRKWIAGIALACSIVLAVLLMNTKTGLIPDEDTGTLFVSVSTAPGSNMQFTIGVMDQIEKIVLSYPDSKSLFQSSRPYMTGGSGSSGQRILIIQLKDWSERKGDEHSSTAIMNQLNRDMQQVTEGLGLRHGSKYD